MSALNIKLRRITDAYGSEGFAHWCPGCEEAHVVWHKQGSRGGITWSYDGNAEAPTTKPSIRLFDENGTICHYFLIGGKIEFCGDCRHQLSGKTVDLPDWPYVEGTYGGIEE